MDDKKLEALIVLLDDADPEVVEVVEKELLTLGDYAIDYLEKKKLQSDFKDRIENVIQKIVSKTQTQNLLNWRLNGGSDLLQGWLLVSHFENHDFKDEIIKNTINKLVNKIWLATNAYMNLSEKLRLISQTLFQIELFTGDIDKINDPQYFFIDKILSTKISGSLGLSALYFYICQKLDIQVSIINFNGYYAIRYYDSVTHFYIDPYNKGIFFTPEEVQSFLKQLNQEENLMHYKPLSNIYVILHIINLVIVLNKKEGEDDKAERFKELLRNIEIKMP